MQFGNGRYQIVFNGEVYNYQEIKRRTGAEGSSLQPLILIQKSSCMACHEWGTNSRQPLYWDVRFCDLSTIRKKI